MAQAAQEAVTAEELLTEIADYCLRRGMAETTFGRRAVNDGKLVSRLQQGARVTPQTVQRVRSFIEGAEAEADANPQRNFRFYDNRQKYLMFVSTCSEKWVVARRVAQELGAIQPRPPAVRIFDAGVGDGTVLTRVMRTMHVQYPFMPFYIVGKEISLEDVRLSLEKMPDRFMEHPATCLVMTNLYYAEAPWLRPNKAEDQLVWKELALKGATAHEFDEQINALQAFLAENWRADVSRSTGRPRYEKPVVLVIYREDNRFLMDSVIPRQGAARADYDLVIASQPFRARAPAAFKAEKVLAPLAKALAPGGRLLGIQSAGEDPAQEIIQRVWPGENPFIHTRHDLLSETRRALGADGEAFSFDPDTDERSFFRYEMHTLPGEIGDPQTAIGASTVFAAWNDAAYVSQIEDDRLEAAMGDANYLAITRDVLQKHGGLWFRGEAFVISRKPA
jgi:SAM-dependent methyltransferase